jgi:hypothetical protein
MTPAGACQHYASRRLLHRVSRLALRSLTRGLPNLVPDALVRTSSARMRSLWRMFSRFAMVAMMEMTASLKIGWSRGTAR